MASKSSKTSSTKETTKKSTTTTTAKSKKTVGKASAEVNLMDLDDSNPSDAATTTKNGGGDNDPFHVFQTVDEATDGGKKRLSVEQIYQKKTQLEHILLRPSTYIGSIDPHQEDCWVYDAESESMELKNISYVPGLYKIFDEIVVNAADNKQRDKSMTTIRIDIKPELNQIRVWNNGRGIPVVEHRVEKMYVPELIFGTLLTSSNYDDTENRLTGGLNGFGAKLCNIFSKEFTVETSSKEHKKAFKQTWYDNMGRMDKATITPSKGDDYTCVTFVPDLEKFKLEKLDDGIVQLMSRRAYDLAGSANGVTVFLNGTKLPIKGFKQYIELYTKGHTNHKGEQIKVCYDEPNERWQVAVALSDTQAFQQISFVNSIATMKGGRHVDYVCEQMTDKLLEAVKKQMKKSGMNIRAAQIKNHMWVFVNCLIVNPTFDSQTKENMTLQSKSFGSKCTLNEKFIQQACKSGIVESVCDWLMGKAQQQLNKQCHAGKHSKLKGFPKLDDANDAGTRNSHLCTLILTEGDSAKSLAVAGLSVIGRDRYGVFPLRGKVLNVREASHKQIMENTEINALIKIVGLQYKKKYDTDEDIKTLRYGHVMIMTDQDQDGSHIKGLLINFIHHNWPSLLQRNFLEEFITPIVKVSKGREKHSFYSMPEYEEWKNSTIDWNKWKIKYYKGLGTSTAPEAKEYFGDLVRHRVVFKYGGNSDDQSIDLAFSKKKTDDRKDWLTGWMVDRKLRREQNMPDIYLYEKDTTQVTYTDFVNKELILFSNMDNERSIPCLVDGLKPGQRKVMFTCFKRNDKHEVKVAQLAGSVAEHSAYHHGEQSLMSTIINLAQDFIGSNNINLLLPNGQFGTRLQGGKDAASPRYIFTLLNPVTRTIFPAIDDAILTPTWDDNKKTEPEWYCPIVPMILINGAEGIGTGWSTKVPLYNPRDIIENIRRMIREEEPLPLKPWYKNYRGTIIQCSPQRFIDYGEIGILDDESVEITELPHDVATQSYKEGVLEPMLSDGKEKTKDKDGEAGGKEKAAPPALTIKNYTEYHTDRTVRFVVTMAAEKLAKLVQENSLHKVFKLSSSITLTSMVLFTADGCLKKFESVDDILKEFYVTRLAMYDKRKEYLDGFLQAEANRLSNQARFILEKIDNKIIMERKKKKAIVDQLVARNYDPDPVKRWREERMRKENPLGNDDDAQNNDEETGDENDQTIDVEPVDTRMRDFDYLVTMQLIKLSEEEVAKLLAVRDRKHAELATLRAKTPKDLWAEDLEKLVEALDVQEAKERDEAAGAGGQKKRGAKKEEDDDDDYDVGGGASSKAKKPRRGKGGKLVNAAETYPSTRATRVEPTLDAATKEKYEKADKLKENKTTGGGGGKRGTKRKSADDLENSSLMKRIKKRDSSEVLPVPDNEGIKRFFPTKKPMDKAAGSSSDGASSGVAKKQAAATKKPKKVKSDSESESEEEEDSDDDSGSDVIELDDGTSDSDGSFEPSPPSKKAKSTAAKPEQPKKTTTSVASTKPKEAAGGAASSKTTSKPAAATKPKKPTVTKKKTAKFDDDSDEDMFVDEDGAASSENDTPGAPTIAASRPARSRKPAVYNIDDDDDEDDE